MSQKGDVYKCDVCGSVVSVLQGGEGELVCCGEEMKKLSPQEAQALK
jgi:superoxide reductase